MTKVKLRIGPDWEADLDTLAEVRSLLGPRIQLMVDGSEIFTLPTAQRVATALHGLDVQWFEEPLPQGNRAGIESLARTSPVAIAYGEHLFGADDAIDAMRREQLQVLQPDASTCGGLAEARRMAQAAVPFGVRVVPHVCAGPVSLAANLHLAATVPAIRLIEYPPSLAQSWSTFGDRHRLRSTGHRRRNAGGAHRSRASASISTRLLPTPIPIVHRVLALPAPSAGFPIASSATADDRNTKDPHDQPANGRLRRADRSEHVRVQRRVHDVRRVTPRRRPHPRRRPDPRPVAVDGVADAGLRRSTNWSTACRPQPGPSAAAPTST